MSAPEPRARRDAGEVRSPGPVPTRIVVMTGMSGAGISTSLKALEDLGFEAVDNLPLRLLPLLIKETAGGERPLALSVDSRTRDFAADALAEMIAGLRVRSDRPVDLVVLDSSDEVLQRRYTETRRRHPLALDRPVLDGIALERGLIAPLREIADVVLDTTEMTLHDLRRQMAERFAPERGPGLFVQVTSFAYRHGLPREADLVFDVRFLRNPHWEATLRPLTGHDAAVGEHIRGDPAFAGFETGLKALIDPLLPRYRAEGKSYLTLAFGCSGGRHRSVFLAERMAAHITDAGYRVAVQHRELDGLTARATPRDPSSPDPPPPSAAAAKEENA